MTYVVRAKGYRQSVLETLDELETFLRALGCTGLGPGKTGCWGTFQEPGTKNKYNLHLAGDVEKIRENPYLRSLTLLPVKRYVPKPKKPKQRNFTGNSIHDRLMRGESVPAYRPQ